MRRSLAVAGGAVVACVLAGAPLHAQGSSVDQHGACMSGRVGAGVALPCDDASAVYFSPAGLASTPTTISLGAAIIRSSNVFRYDPAMVPGDGTLSVERKPEWKAVPQGYLNYRVTPRLAAGVGVFFPYGLGLKWPVCDAATPNCGKENFEGRFTGYDNELRGMYVQPTVAYQVLPGRLSVGAGLAYVMGSIDVNRRLTGPAALGLGTTEIADLHLQGDGTGTAYHLSAIGQLDGRTSLGVRYLSSAEIDLDGDADFTQISTGNAGVDGLIASALPGNQGVASNLEFPAQLVVGLAHAHSDALRLFLDYQRTYWSSFDALPVDFETAPDESLELNYSDANAFRVAAEYDATEAMVLRAGFRYNEAATPHASPFLPEGERNYYSLGLGYRVTPALSTDFSFQYVNQPDRAGVLVPGGPRAGVYEATGLVFNFTLAYRFGGSASY